MIIIFYVSVLISWLAFIYGFNIKVSQINYKLIVFLILASALGDTLNFGAVMYYKLTGDFPPQLNTGLFYRLIEFILLIFFYQTLLHFKKGIAIFISVAAALYFLLLYPQVPFGGLYAIDSTGIRATNCILFSSLSIYFLFIYMKDASDEKPLQNPMLYIVSAILIYFTSIIFIVLLNSYITTINRALGNAIWEAQNIFLIVRNVLFCIAFYHIYQSHRQ